MRRDIAWMGLGGIVSGPLTVVLGLWAIQGFAPPAWLFIAMTLVLGLATGFVLVPYRTTIQRETPPDRIARVFAAAEAIVIVVVMISPFLGSLIANAWGVGTTFAVGGAGLALLGLSGLAFGLRQKPFGHSKPL